MIFVECNADFALVESLGVAKRNIVHAFGKGPVCKRLSDSVDGVGMVDEDPAATQPSYFKRLREDSFAHDVRVLNDGDRRLVVLCPRLEEWVLASAEAAGIDVADFGFDSKNLHEMMGEKPDRLKKLTGALKEKKSPRIERLEKLLKS